VGRRAEPVDDEIEPSAHGSRAARREEHVERGEGALGLPRLERALQLRSGVGRRR
jgi:hypothetical protein